MVEDEEVPAPFPPLPIDSSADHGIPLWARELANARSGRQSRASSMVSTRTRFSTTTIDDTRSIDIQAGGQTFRISRFGDRIIDTTAPPPYPGSIYTDELPTNSELLHTENTGEHDIHEHHRHHHHPPFHRTRGPGRRYPRRVRIATPDNGDSDYAHEDDPSVANTLSQALTEEDLTWLEANLPSRLKEALGIDTCRSNREASKSTDDPGYGSSLPDNDEAREDKRPRSASNSSSPQHIRPASSDQIRSILRPWIPSNTDSIMLEPEVKRWSPLGERTRQQFESLRGIWKLPRSFSYDSGQSADRVPRAEEMSPNASVETVRASLPSEEEPSIPLTATDLNELSQVYNKVIRDLDRENRKQLHSRDKELDQLRILLHEKDVVYRQLIKGKDFVIDDLMKRLDHLEETLESKLERARYEVEEQWETRWKEHDRQLMAKCGLMKPLTPGYMTRDTQTDD